MTYLLAFYTPKHTAGGVAYVATSAMIQLNSAVNPIVYAEPTLPAEDQANGLLSLPPSNQQDVSLQGIAKDQQCKPHDQGEKRRNLQGSPHQGHWPGD